MPLATQQHWVESTGNLPWWYVSRLTNGATHHAAKQGNAKNPAFSRDLLDYESKVDFANIVSDLDGLDAQSRERIHAILAGVQDKIVALVSRKLTSGELTTKFVNDLELRGVGQLVPTLREVLSAAFRQGQQAIKAEIKKGSQGVTRNATAEAKALVEAQPEWDHARIVTALKTYKVTHTLEGLPPEKALEFFESKATLWGAQIRDPLLIEIKMILFDAIKMGTPLREVQANLTRAFLPWLGDPSHIIDDKILEPYRLEAMIRTNTIEALNEGRKAQAQPEVESGFITGFMFSAILDDRVTPVCSYLDAKIFRPNSPELDRLSPPRRFNCRSILVPILRTEGPVTYITPSQVAKGVALSGKGFCQEHAHA